MNDQQALLRAVLEAPDDDAPRLVYADWLDEHDDDDTFDFGVTDSAVLWTRSGNGFARWAAHIRWAVAHPEIHGVCLCGLYPEKAPCDRCEDLGPQVNTIPRRRGSETKYVEHRGFVREVRVWSQPFMDHAKVMFATHPITSVRLVDRQPWPQHESVAMGFSWAKWSADPTPTNCCLPGEVFDKLEKFRGGEYAHSRWYLTREDAYAALSRACVRYGRELVGLPPIQ